MIKTWGQCAEPLLAMQQEVKDIAYILYKDWRKSQGKTLEDVAMSVQGFSKIGKNRILDYMKDFHYCYKERNVL